MNKQDRGGDLVQFGVKLATYSGWRWVLTPAGKGLQYDNIKFTEKGQKFFKKSVPDGTILTMYPETGRCVLAFEETVDQFRPDYSALNEAD